MMPRIAIPVPTSTDVPYNQRSWPSYARAVTLSGGEPVTIPLDLPVKMLRELIASCEGVLLPLPLNSGSASLRQLSPHPPSRFCTSFNHWTACLIQS